MDNVKSSPAQVGTSPWTRHAIPSHFAPLYSPAAIHRAVTAVGEEITGWAQKCFDASGLDVVAVPVLRGGIIFFGDLVRAVHHSLEVAPGRAWGYEVGLNGVQSERMRLDLTAIPTRDRSVLLVDDVCDSGRTLAAMTERLLEEGAREVRSAVLVRRVLPEPRYLPNWSAFSYEGDEWFVGYGMEDGERWRNLPGVYVIQPAGGT
jgi:hypoxanthine phosphoribosyltransferase